MHENLTTDRSGAPAGNASEARAIHVTAQDMKRLRKLIELSARRGRRDDRDRPYLVTLGAELDEAVIIEARATPPDIVTMNSKVLLRDGRQTWTMTLVFPEDSDPEEGCISVLAPLGAAILGCRVGQSVRFRVPGGAERSCEIISVLYQPEAAGHHHL